VRARYFRNRPRVSIGFRAAAGSKAKPPALVASPTVPSKPNPTAETIPDDLPACILLAAVDLYIAHPRHWQALAKLTGVDSVDQRAIVDKKHDLLTRGSSTPCLTIRCLRE
jgi:hypothetical protein